MPDDIVEPIAGMPPVVPAVVLLPVLPVALLAPRELEALVPVGG